MMSEQCKNDAVFMVHWPGRDIKMCAYHQAKAAMVASAMGFVVSITPTTGQCQSKDKAEQEAQE